MNVIDSYTKIVSIVITVLNFFYEGSLVMTRDSLQKKSGTMSQNCTSMEIKKYKTENINVHACTYINKRPSCDTK